MGGEKSVRTGYRYAKVNPDGDLTATTKQCEVFATVALPRGNAITLSPGT